MYRFIELKVSSILLYLIKSFIQFVFTIDILTWMRQWGYTYTQNRVHLLEKMNKQRNFSDSGGHHAAKFIITREE